MSDTEPQADGEQLLADAIAAPETETGDTAQPTIEQLTADLNKWKALSRQNEAQAKANAEKARQFDAFEEANKTELQKAQDQAAAAIQRAEAAELAAIREHVANQTGVPADLLTGADQDSLAASAQQLLDFAQSQHRAPAAGGADITAGGAKPVIYHASQIADPAFFQAHRADILQAQMEGRIIP